MIGTNSGIGQAQGNGSETANPQQVGAQSLQMTQNLQGMGSSQNVLGITDVLQTPNTSNQITVEGSDGSNTTAASTQQIPETPAVDPNGFVFAPWLVTAVVVGICIVAFVFIWSQRKPSRY